MWCPSSTFLIFLLSTARVPPTDVTLIDFFIVLLFSLLFFLLCLASLSALALSLCLFHTQRYLSVFLPLYFQRWMWQQLIFFSFFQLILSLSLSLLTSFFVFPSIHLFLFLSVVNVLIFSSGGARDECRLNCRMANNCTTLIAILHLVFQNNQIRLCVCAFACGHMCVHQPQIMQMSAENCRSTAAISSLLSVGKDWTAADFA